MILSRDELLERRQEWREAGKKIVFTNGCFDLIHLGHVRYLEEARQQGDLLVLGLNSDESVRRLKGRLRPLVSQEERAAVMNALKPVDYVVIFGELTAEQIVAELEPEIYVKGGDYATTPTESQPESQPPKSLPEAKVVQAYGGKVVLIPFLSGHSTSELIAKILQLYCPTES